MNIVIAHSTAVASAGHETYCRALCAFLEAEGHKTQRLDLPSIMVPGRVVTNIASFRLLGTAASADVLICLDAVAAVLEHPRKIVWLLDDSFLDGAPWQLAGECAPVRDYVANVLRWGLTEAKLIFAPSHAARSRLRALAVRCSDLLQLRLPAVRNSYPRNAGPELLVMSPINERQRPELLIACLAALPEPWRARWVVTRNADPASIDLLRKLTRAARLEARLVVDARNIDRGERAYLLSQAAAYIDLTPASLAISEEVDEALEADVTVVACTDGGAVTERLNSRLWLANPEGTALAAVLRKATVRSAVAPVRKVPASAVASNEWAPLVKALAQ